MRCVDIARRSKVVAVAELDDDSGRVLDLLKACDEPTAHDAERVRRAVWARVGLAGVAATTVATGVHVVASGGAQAATLTAASVTGGSVAPTVSSVGLHTAWVVTAAKVGVAVALLGAGGWYGARVLGSAHERAPLTSVPPPLPQPLVNAGAPQSAASAAETNGSQPAQNFDELAPKLDVPSAERPQQALARDRSPNTASGKHTELAAEVALLAAAQHALAQGKYAEALSSLNTHAERYPHGALSGEREASRAIALCRSGELTRGQVVAQRYLARHSGSPLCSRVKSACQIER
jgi:hypothetical protein